MTTTRDTSLTARVVRLLRRDRPGSVADLVPAAAEPVTPTLRTVRRGQPGQRLYEDFISTSQSTSSGGYTDLATVGPTVSLPLAIGETILVLPSVFIRTNNTGAGARAAWAVSGATTRAAQDNEACTTSNTDGAHLAHPCSYTATASGWHTFTMKYRSGGATCYASRRRLVILAL